MTLLKILLKEIIHFFFGKTSDVDYKAVSIVVMELGMLATIYV